MEYIFDKGEQIELPGRDGGGAAGLHVFFTIVLTANNSLLPGGL